MRRRSIGGKVPAPVARTVGVTPCCTLPVAFGLIGT